MSREHKYRAWDENGEIMYYSDAGWNKAHPESEDCIFDFHEGRVVAFLRQTEPGTIDEPPYDYGEPVECEEYIGQKDKNDVELYESDVVDADSNNQGLPGVVVWAEKSNGWALEIVSGYYKGRVISFTGELVVITGNIHENPASISEKGTDRRTK